MSKANYLTLQGRPMRLIERQFHEPIIGKAVYFAVTECDGYVKIGVGNTPSKRLIELQVGCPFSLRIVHVCAGGLELEKKLHRRFAPFNTSGEWFAITPEVASGISEEIGIDFRSLLARPPCAITHEPVEWGLTCC